MGDVDLYSLRDRARADRERILDQVKRRGAKVLNYIEDREFRRLTDLVADYDERLSEEQRRDAARSVADGIFSRSQASSGKPKMGLERISEPLVYSRETAICERRSYIRDLFSLVTNTDDGSAAERLRRHAQDVATADAYREYRTGINTTVGTGGTFTPPAYLLDQYIIFARPGRPFADIVANYRLPGDTMQINIPKVTTGTAVGWQATQNTNLTEQDLADTYVTANVATIGGNQILSRQLIDQAGIAIDEVVFRDLTAAHAQTLDATLFTGTGSGGQILGIDGISGIQTIPAGGLTIQFVYAAIANAVQLIHTTRFQPPDAIVLHPRRWGWFLSLLDSQERPLFVPNANHPMNAAGILERVAPQAIVGQMHGLPVVADANVPTNLGAGSNQDPIYVVRSSDLALYESGLRAEAWPQTFAQQLSVLLQVSSYVAFASRYPQSIVEISGLTPPTFGS